MIPALSTLQSGRVPYLEAQEHLLMLNLEINISEATSSSKIASNYVYVTRPCSFPKRLSSRLAQIPVWGILGVRLDSGGRLF